MREFFEPKSLIGQSISSFARAAAMYKEEKAPALSTTRRRWRLHGVYTTRKKPNLNWHFGKGPCPPTTVGEVNAYISGRGHNLQRDHRADARWRGRTFPVSLSHRTRLDRAPAVNGRNKSAPSMNKKPKAAPRLEAKYEPRKRSHGPIRPTPRDSQTVAKFSTHQYEGRSPRRAHFYDAMDLVERAPASGVTVFKQAITISAGVE